MTDIIGTSVVPELWNAGKSALSAAGEGAGWLKTQFDQANPRAQQLIMAGAGLFGGAILGNIIANFTGAQGTWAGTGLKWGLALAAMTLLSSDANPFKAPIAEETAQTQPATEAELTAATDPRNPWRDTNGDGQPDRFEPTAGMRPVMAGP